MEAIKVVAFDTGGTILDWHGGLVAVLTECGARCGVECDWHAFANEYRRRSLQRMLGALDPGFDNDDVHREVLDALLDEDSAIAFSAEERRVIAVPLARARFVARLRAGAQAAAAALCPCLVHNTTLALVIDVSRRNMIDWDAVIACEMLRVYKPRPEAYRRAAKLLEASPGDILMVACHNFDLDAARGQGYRTAFVRRPAEWGPAGPPDPVPNLACDLVVTGFAELADALQA